MRISVADAEGQLTDLVRRVRDGEDVVLTRDGMPAARLVVMEPLLEPADRLALIRHIQASAAKNMIPGPCAARSQDFLYDEDGLPG